ncbi:MAG: hypothetical protein GY810_31605 [Aureispira sp.]|nr:hypothetical protein [Aureispira sp.]
MKTTLPSRIPVFLLLLWLMTFTGCSAEEEAEFEGFLFTMFSLAGLIPIAIGTGLALAYKNSPTKGGALFAFSIVFLVMNAVILLAWTIILLQEWPESKAYQFGEGIITVMLFYTLAVVGVIASITGVFSGKNGPQGPIHERVSRNGPVRERTTKKIKLIDEDDDDEEFDLLEDLEKL